MRYNVCAAGDSGGDRANDLWVGGEAGEGNHTVFERFQSTAAMVHGIQSFGDPVDVGDSGAVEGAMHTPARESALIGLVELFDTFDEFAVESCHVAGRVERFEARWQGAVTEIRTLCAVGIGFGAVDPRPEPDRRRAR